MKENVLVRVEALKKYFPIEKGLFRSNAREVRAVDGIDFDINRDEVLGLAGESGCGKSTLARLLLALLTPNEGRVAFEGRDINTMDKRSLKDFRRKAQLVFQDPYGSLDPRMRISDILSEPLIVNGIRDRSILSGRVRGSLADVNLSPDHLTRYPDQFSGGERQRIGIARALMTRPSFVVCDEPVSSLDVSIQAEILKLIKEIRESLGLTYLFITHDLRVLESISDRVMVMYLGKIAEIGPTEAVYGRPLHPYTALLLDASERKRGVVKGEPASNIALPSGCRFRTRCKYAKDRCVEEEPVMTEAEAGHFTSCHFRLK
ncbi:MAG: hypothetical protein AUJ75_01905 [Candidatus Omnitrophica bacterium CG1_02_49_10]|nr:MAG: hypothetical protein AUJ75_01905 [Candidatus Omnitrophica bacterium CG1_02_49_10]